MSQNTPSSTWYCSGERWGGKALQRVW